MDEKYLSELWNWTNSQDPTFKDRYTFDSWSKKLKSNEGYKKQFYGWVSGIDETFEERRPYNVWSEMVSSDKKKEESALFSREGGTLSATPGTEPQKPSAFSQFQKEDSQYKPFASFAPAESKAKTPEVVKAESEKALDQAKRGVSKEVYVSPSDLKFSPGVTYTPDGRKLEDKYAAAEYKAEELQNKYGDFGFTFQRKEGVVFGEKIVAQADDGSAIEIDLNADESEEAKKLQSFLFSRSGGEKKRDFTPEEMLVYSDRNAYQNISKSKYDRLYSDENVKKSLEFFNKKINSDLDGLKQDKKSLEAEASRINALGDMATQEDIDKFNNMLEVQKMKFKSVQDEAILADRSIKNVVAERIEREREKGTLRGATYNSLIKGVENLTKGAVDVLFESTDMLTRPLLPMDQEKKRKYTEYMKDWMTSSFDQLKARGVTDAFVEDQNMLFRGLIAVPEFLPTLFLPGGPIGRMAAMATQGIGRRMEEYDNSPEMQSMMSREEAFLLNTGKSIVEAKLENVGITQALAGKGLANSLLIKALQKWSPNMGTKALNGILNMEVKSLAAKAALNTAGAFIAEAETGALQNIMETSINELYNAAKEKEVFKQPKVFTQEWMEGVAEDAIMEGIGGMWMGGAANIAKYTAEGVLGAKLSNEEFAIVKKMLSDGFTLEALMVDLKSKVINGEVSVKEMNRTLANFSKAASIVGQMPEGDLSDGQQRVAFDLLNERMKLEAEIKGKDPNLVSKKTKRISEINERLKLISENAVQEQTTSEVPVQPEAAVGEEVAEGTPEAESEVAAEEEIDIFKLGDTEYELGDDGKWYNAETLEEIDEETSNKVKAEAKPSKKIPKRGSKGTIAGVKVTYPTMQEARERRAARNEAKYVEDSSENLEEENTDVLAEDLQGEFGILTAENPMAQPLTEEENKQLNQKAEEWLKEKGYNPRRVTGKYGQAENSFFVKGLTKEDAIAFAKKFNQDSVAHSEGLVYQDGAMNPRVKSEDSFAFEDFTPESNFVSVVKTKDGLKTFKIGYDFDTKTTPETTTETGQQQTLAAEQGTPTTIEGTGLRENIKKSIAKVFKSFEVKSFKNAKEMAAYAKAKFNEETGNRDAARVFAGSDGTVEVLVNEELADDTALGHEVWHALLLKAFGDNQAKFAEFRDAIDKTLRQNGYEDIAENLKKFASRYGKDEVPAEEYLAQLGGMMTSANIDLKNLDKAQRTLLEQIKDIINDFAIQLTGQPVFLKEATPETILDFMSTMSDMMAKGEDVSGFFADEAGRVIDKNDVTINTRASKKVKFKNNKFETKQPIFNPKSGKATGFTFIADRMATGEWTGLDPKSGIKIPLMGGIGYPMLKKMYKKVGWAVEGGTVMSTFLRKIVNSKTGIGFPVLMSEYAHVSNLTFAKIFEAEMKWMVKSGQTTQEQQLENVNKYISEALIASKDLSPKMKPDKNGKLVDKNANAPLRTFATESNGKYTPKVYTSMDQVYKDLEGTFDARGLFMKTLIGVGVKNRYAKIEKYGFPDMVRAADETSDPRLKGIPSGTSVSAIQFNKEKAAEFVSDIESGAKLSEKHSAKSIGVDAHISYQYPVEGESLGWLTGVIEMSEAEGVDEDTKEWYKDQRNKYKEGKISEAQLRSNVTAKSRASMPEVEIKTRAQKVERNTWQKNGIKYTVGDIIDGSKLDELSGDLVDGKKGDKYILTQEPLSSFTESREELLRINSGYEKEESFRLDDIIENFEKTPPIPPDGDGMHRIIAAKELGFNTILMWKKLSDYKSEVTTRAQKAQPTEATENDFVLPFGKYKGQWYSTTPKNYKEFLLKQDWFDPRKYFAKTIENANESFGTEDGEVSFKSRAQKIDKKKTKKLSSSIINSFNEEELENAKSLINKVEPPKKTIKAYKLFKVKKEFPGELFPLFVGANESVTTGEWIEAKAGELTQTKEGKTMVKSTLGPLAYRPGWHSGDIAVATHIGSKKNASDKAPTLRADDQVWAEVEVGNDFDWQAEANNRASKTKDGKVVPRTAHITDQVPSKGFYKYKTNSNMTGSWIISGEMKVNRVLTEKEVEEINKKSNAKDLPRLTPFDYEAYGFSTNGSVKNPKQVIANQIARAYQVAKENGDNPELVSFVEKKAITRAQKAQPQTIPGYDRMIGEVQKIVDKSKQRGVSADQIAENVINYIQKSRVYERADDLQREQIIRDARKDLGLRQKSAPRVDRVLGIKDSVSTEDKKNLMEVIKAQVKATKNLVKAQKEIAKQINKEIRELKEKGKITTSQMIAALRRLSEVDLLNEESVSNFLDYIARVFKDAAYYERVTNINRKRRAARNSASTKIGIADGLTPLLQKIFSIDARTIPEKALDAYEELVNMFADRSRVLQLSDIENVTKMAQKVFEAVEGEVERARSLAEVLSNYENMATDENGNIEFSKTVDQMVNDGSISAEDGELMKKYKSMILEEAGLKKEKDVRSEEEIEEERQQLVETVQNYTPVFFQLPTQDERNVAREIFRLIKTGAIDKMSNKDLKDLLRIIDNIERGFLPHSAQIMKERMNQINNGETLSEAVNNAKMLPVESRYAKIKALFGGSAIRKAIDRNPLFFIDELFGNFKSTPIFDSIFKPISRAFSSYQSEVNTINRKIQNAMDEMSNSLGKNPNRVQFAKQKIMAYMLESEYQANPNSKEVRSAKDFLDATIKYAEETEQNSYSDKDIENLKKIRDQFFSGEAVDLDAMLESFSPAEKKAIKTISDINNELATKVAFTSAIIRGRKVGALNNYIHHNTLGERSAADIATEVSMADVFNASMKPSTKAKSLIERTGAATPLVFDPFSSTTRGARQLLMDYHLTEPIRTARRTVKYAESKVTGKQKRILNAISGALEQALSNTLINTYHETTFVEDAIRYMEQTGYRAMLGSIPRAVAELTSNLSYVMLYDPASFKSGISKYRSVAMSEAGLSVMKNVKSQQTERLYPASKLSGRGLDKEVMSQASGIKAGKSQNDVMNAMTVAYNYSGKQVKNFAEATADALIGSPDKAIMKPLWFGAFASEFKKATGQDVDYDKIANNNEAYLTEFSEAIDQAAQHADETSVRVGASDNPFTGILKGANAANQSAMKQAFNKFNNFMSRFLIYEYTTARTGVYALMGSGKLTQKQGAAILGATMSRMIVYSLLSKELVSIMMGMLGFGDDEEDEKTFLQKVGQATGSAFSGLILGRNFGNFTKAPINIGVEKVNKEFLDFLREGEYDPYEDAIQYTIIPKEERKQGDIMEYVKSFSGAFSPMIGTMQRTLEVAARDPKTQAAQERRLRELSTRTPLEILGNTGYIPLYRDVRKIVMESLYEDMRNEKKSSGSGGIKTSIDTKIK